MYFMHVTGLLLLSNVKIYAVCNDAILPTFKKIPSKFLKGILLLMKN